MVKLSDYKELRIWKLGMKIAEDTYTACKALPAHERFGVTSQMQRAAFSIPSNIAEGYGRGSRKDYAHFLCIAKGSAAELETQVLLVKRLYPDFPSSQLISDLCDARKMLSSLISKLKT